MKPFLKLWTRALRRTALPVLLVVLLLGLLPSLALLIFSITWTGRLAALGLIGLITCTLVVLRRGWPWKFDSRNARLVFAASVGVSLLLFTPAILRRDSGQGTCETLRVEHVFLDPDHGFPRWSIGNLIPEADQVSVGLALASCLLPELDGPKVERVRSLTMPLYEELDGDSCFGDLGSVMAFAHAEFSLSSPDRGHYVAILPGDREPVASILWLHGSGGNFSCLWYALSPLARDHGIALFFPSFGFGNWDRRLSQEVIERTREDVLERFGIDPTTLHLAALSRGGVGAVRSLAHSPKDFERLILVSTVPAVDWIEKGREVEAWSGRPVYWIHGTEDRRVPLEKSGVQAEALERAGALVTRRLHAEEDHYVLFSKRGEILDDLARWLEVEATRRP